MMPGPIPFSAIDRFATRYDLSLLEFERLESAIRQIDEHFRAAGKKPEPEAPAKPAPPRRNPL